MLAQYTPLYSFSGSPNDGTYPSGAPVLSGSSLYGMSAFGGTNNAGTIFQVGIDGTGFTLLHSFARTTSDGFSPEGSLLKSGSKLYGMTPLGGPGTGTLFQIGIDGTGYGLLHSFGGGGDGVQPEGSLIQSGPTLYGMTRGGGSSGNGTIFQIGADGTGYSVLHSFGGFGSEGGSPIGSLLLGGSKLYGMTYGGGNGVGTIFQIGTDGTGFSLLHSFSGLDGINPYGSLIQSGSTLYGMARYGGASNIGTIFKIGIDGTGFDLLHIFRPIASDGRYPQDSLIQLGSTLYGTTYFGGSNGEGTIFQIGTDGTGFSILHSFAYDGGYHPAGSLIYSGSTFYGFGSEAGSGGYGTVFSLVPEPSSVLLALTGGLLMWNWRRRGA